MTVNATYDRECDLAIGLALRAGALVLGMYESDHEIERKADQTPVTEADYAAEQLVLDALAEEGFGYDIVSEESGRRQQGSTLSERVWVVDPIDGTQYFIDRSGWFSVMIALLERTRPVLGVVYAPMLERLWYAVLGEGAFLSPIAEPVLERYGTKAENGDGAGEDVARWVRAHAERIRVSDRSPGTIGYRLIAGPNRVHGRLEEIKQSLAIETVVTMGGTGVKCALIGSGAAELYVQPGSGLGVWDCAPAEVIVREAGGAIWDLTGAPPHYDLQDQKMVDGFVACNGVAVERVRDATVK